MGQPGTKTSAFQRLAEVLSANQRADFFDALVQMLAELSRADHAWIARVDETGTEATTVSAWSDGKWIDNFHYQVTGTPCDFDDAPLQIHSADLKEKFPEAPLLNSLQAETYMASPMKNRDGRRIGLMVLFWKDATEYPNYTPELLRLAALQTAGEMERRRAEASLRESERRLTTLMSHLPGMAYQCRNDAKWSADFVSSGVKKLTGYTYDDLVVNKRVSPADLYHPDDFKRVSEQVEADIAARRPFEVSYRLIRADDEIRWVWERGQAIYDEAGIPVRLEGFIADVTQQQLAFRTQRAVMKIAEAMTVRSGPDYFYQLVTHLTMALDADAGFIATFQDEESGELQMQAAVVDGRRRPRQRFPKSLPAVRQVMEQGQCVLREGAQFAFPSRSRAGDDGAEGYVGWRLDDSEGRPIGMMAVLSRSPWEDSELALSVLKIFAAGVAGELERQRADQQIRELAFTDPVTNLANRAWFMHNLNDPKYREQNLTCLLFDINRFKQINDTRGYGVGDQVLKALGERCQEALGEGDLCARLGGDEFAVLFESLEKSAVEAVASDLSNTLNAVLRAGETLIDVETSFGVAHSAPGSNDRHLLFRQASIALHEAKRQGSRLAFFDQSMADRVFRDQMLYERLYDAIKNDGLSLAFQPQIDLNSGELVGAEVLCRWQDDEWGWISPGEFIPLAEERGLVSDLGDWVLRQACQQLSAWISANHATPQRLSVNVSAYQLQNRDLVNQISAVCDGLDPSRITLELTESGLMRDPDLAVRITRSLTDMGFELAIDDFGTGYSSLSYLRRFSADTLKIDMSFIRDMLTNGHDKAIVQTIIGMARTLGMKTVAEGVETAEHVATLQAMGCDQAQGFYYGRPVAAEDFAREWLEVQS